MTRGPVTEVAPEDALPPRYTLLGDEDLERLYLLDDDALVKAGPDARLGILTVLASREFDVLIDPNKVVPVDGPGGIPGPWGLVDNDGPDVVLEEGHLRPATVEDREAGRLVSYWWVYDVSDAQVDR